VEPERQLHLAETLRTCREHLESTLDEIQARDALLTDLEVRLTKEVAAARLRGVEDQLRFDARRRMRRPRLRIPRWAPARLKRYASRLRGLIRPRIGMLRQYAARPLTVPAHYVNLKPPSPAPTISIVTPSYAQGRFLERTLHSVFSQGYPALEYFVQDGGSTDETPEILQRYDRLLTGWTSEPDDGQADAINRAFEHCTGEIMAWLNSDDLLLPGSLAYVARYFTEHPAVDVVYGHRIMIDQNDGQIGAWILPSHDDAALTVADYIPQETLFWRRRIWDVAGGHVDPSFGYALDWDLLLRFRAADATMVRLPRFLGAFRIHEEQKTSAEHALGMSETMRLRRRVYGRDVPIEEVMERLRPYLKRHVLVHSWQRCVDRLPLRRIVVPTLPGEPPPSPAVTERRRTTSLNEITAHSGPVELQDASDVEAGGPPPFGPVTASKARESRPPNAQ
jgi:glycosyltransferase involved in cell wall biosynthesis